jgi:hypothetical protein
VAKIGDLTVNLIARTGAWTKGISRARSSTGRMIDTLGKLHLAMGGISRLFGNFGNLFGDVDSLGKTADKLGVTTEALGALRFAGQQTGVEIRTMDMAIQRMVRRVSEAAQGTGEAKNAIKELGLSAEALNRMAPDRQFATLADAMASVTNQGDRIRLAMRLFDSEGVALVNTLALGSSGLDKMKSDFFDLGGAIDREGVAKVEAFNDTWNKVKTGLGNAAKQLLVTLAPALKVIADLLVQIAKLANWVVGGLKKVGRAVTAPFRWVGKQLGFSGGSTSSPSSPQRGDMLTKTVSEQTQIQKRGNELLERIVDTFQKSGPGVELSTVRM